ncbi:MAG: enoyl-CoA hydratase/isomerase family protein [Thermoplasmata archaeon]
MYKNILVDREGPLAFITFNRPKVLNAMNQRTKEEVLSALEELEADDGVKVVIFRGAGEKAFVAGADVKEFVGRRPIDQREDRRQLGFYEAIAAFPKPVIAMIRGYCLGGGCELILACDIRVASGDAKIGQPEINLGLIPGGGGSQRLPRLVGEGKALQLILTGDMISGEEAKAIGLVEEVYPAEELEERTREMAMRIAGKSPIALRLAKEAVRAASNMNLTAGLEYEATLFSLLFSTEDKEEGVKAFLEKRKPSFKGR